MYENYHKHQKESFDLVHWDELYTKAKTHRQNTWDAQANKCLDVRINELPHIKHLPNYKAYEGKFFVDNMIIKIVKWMVSMLSGSVVSFDLQSNASSRDENTELLEEELNLTSAILDIPKQVAPALYDYLYLGMGFVRIFWDSQDVSIAWETGKPVIKHVDAMKMYIDPTTNEIDKSDCKYFFHVERFNYKELSKQYPKYKKQFHDKKDKDDCIEIVTVQYKVTEIVKSMWIIDNAQNPPKKWIIPVSEWEEFKAKGNVLAEQMEISTEFDNRKSFWYEARFFHDIELVIQPPKYIGERSSYHIISYAHNHKSAYSLGLVYFLLDIQNMNIILLTTMTIMTMKYMKPEKIIRGQSLLNQDFYKAFGDQIGVYPETDPVWDEQHKDALPVSYVPLPEFPQGINHLMNLTKEFADDLSGVTKTMKGEPQYSQMSGVAAAQFMSAGKIYHKEEQIKAQQILTEIGYHLMFLLAEYRNFPHIVQHLDVDNQMRNVTVNDPEKSPFFFEPERTLCFAEIVENVELINQIKRDMAMQLKQMGCLSTLDLLQNSGMDNPNRLYKSVLAEQQILEIIEFLNQNPDVKQQLEALIAQNPITNDKKM